MTLKSPESVIGPGETVRLPNVDPTWEFVPRAMLGLVIRGPARSVAADAWHTAVFGYTCVIDVMARGDQQFGRDYWLAKADTLGPLGPCIVTRDELPDPGAAARSLLAERRARAGFFAARRESLDCRAGGVRDHGHDAAHGRRAGMRRQSARAPSTWGRRRGRRSRSTAVGRLAVRVAAPVRSAA